MCIPYSVPPTPTKRRVFFSFHYQEDHHRANTVRTSWVYLNDDNRIPYGFYDASIWETSKRESEESLKTLIRNEIENTSVTCILTGRETFQRPWVRYEIARSVIKGNGLLSVHINGLGNEYGYVSTPGPDPLDFMGLYKRASDGRISLIERDSFGRWVDYSRYTLGISLPSGWPAPFPNIPTPLSQYSDCYDYINNYGQLYLPTWLQTAAKKAGR